MELNRFVPDYERRGLALLRSLLQDPGNEDLRNLVATYCVHYIVARLGGPSREIATSVADLEVGYLLYRADGVDRLDRLVRSLQRGDGPQSYEGAAADLLELDDLELSSRLRATLGTLKSHGRIREGKKLDSELARTARRVKAWIRDHDRLRIVSLRGERCIVLPDSCLKRPPISGWDLLPCFERCRISARGSEVTETILKFLEEHPTDSRPAYCHFFTTVCALHEIGSRHREEAIRRTVEELEHAGGTATSERWRCEKLTETILALAHRFAATDDLRDRSAGRPGRRPKVDYIPSSEERFIWADVAAERLLRPAGLGRYGSVDSDWRKLLQTLLRDRGVDHTTAVMVPNRESEGRDGIWRARYEGIDYVLKRVRKWLREHPGDLNLDSTRVLGRGLE